MSSSSCDHPDGGRRTIGAFAASLAAVAACSASLVVTGVAHAEPADGRAYEKISPVEKNGGQARSLLPVVDPDGSVLLYTQTAANLNAQGAYNENPVIARRTAKGWTATDVSVRTASDNQRGLRPRGISADGSRYIAEAPGDLDPIVPDPTFLHWYGIDAGTRAVTPLVFSEGLSPARWTSTALVGVSRSADTTVFISDRGTSSRVPLLPNVSDDDGAPVIYRRAGAELQLVSQLPGATTAAAGVEVDVRGFGVNPDAGQRANVVSDDGERVYFRAGTNDPSADPSAENPLYLRDGDRRTVLVSASRRNGQEGTPRGARFIGASGDGARAFFFSSDPLTNGVDGPAIYRYDLADGRLERVTGAAGDNGLGLSSPVSSDDGSTVAFIATAALVPDATDGEPNAYVWRDGELRFVGSLGFDGAPVRISRNGRFAIFSTTASLGTAQTGGNATLYRYDVEEGSLVCASCRTDGEANDGPSSYEGAPSSLLIDASNPRGVADDGHVFFTSRARLVAADPSNAPDVYEFTGTEARILSSGTGSSFITDNTDDGRSVFMTSTARLTPGDTDSGDYDMYVRRAGGGFSYPQPPTPCVGDACQPSTPPQVTPPVVASDRPGQGNVSPRVGTSLKELSGVSISAAARRSLARSGRATVSVRVRGRGRISLRATAKIRGKRRTAGAGSRSISSERAVVARITLRLTSTARLELRRERKLTVRVEASMDGVKRKRSTLATLRAVR